MDIKVFKIENPDHLNLILGQSHFIKTVEDMHEAIVATVPGAKFGLAFCEASDVCQAASARAGAAGARKKNAFARRRPQLHRLHARHVPHQHPEHR
jgi:adenosine/AMP kinase